MKLLQKKDNWVPPTKFEEKIKHIIIPGKLYIRRLVLKEWIKGRKDIKYLRYIVKKNYNSIDVGAYKGVYTFFLSKYSKNVFAFEPNPKSYKILKKSVNSNVKVFPYAISNKSDFDFLKIPKGKKGYSNQGGSIRNVKLDSSYGKIEVVTKKIDDLKLKDIGLFWNRLKRTQPLQYYHRLY